MKRQDIEAKLAQILAEGSLRLATLSGLKTDQKISKVSIRPVQIKGQLAYQLSETRGSQAFHRNLSQEECLKWLFENVFNFKQSFFYTTSADYHLLVGKKGQLTFLQKPASKSALELTHNRKKDYIWQEGAPIPFLVQLGVMSSTGKVHAAKSDKFRQINRFLEMIDDILPHLDTTRPLHIVDFGCGKAYLTFALYHFLKFTKGHRVHVTGLDLKSDVIEKCQALAKALGYQTDLHFIQGDINHFETQEQVDLMVSLHACDTATDAALEKAVRWQAQVILCVPCCQHELFNQVQGEALRPLLKHGLLKERFAALVTDAARGQLLEALGYHVQMLEFIDLEHTPKNLLIRAVKCSSAKGTKQAWQAYLDFKERLKIDPSLEKRFRADLNQ